MIEFIDPGTDDVINISAPLPDELKQVLDRLEAAVTETHD